MAKHLRETASSKFWGARANIEEIEAGDVLVSLAPDYDPDPTGREPYDHAGTHVAFVDKILKKGTAFRLIDWSRRKRGRGRSSKIYKAARMPILEEEGIAYSWISLKSFPEAPQEQWESQYFGQKRSYVRIISALYIKPRDEQIDN